MKKALCVLSIIVGMAIFSACSTIALEGSMSLAYSAMEKKNYEKALDQLSSANRSKKATPEIKAEIISLPATCYEELGRNEDAIGALKYLVVTYPDTLYAFQAEQKLKWLEKDISK